MKKIKYTLPNLGTISLFCIFLNVSCHGKKSLTSDQVITPSGLARNNPGRIRTHGPEGDEVRIHETTSYLDGTLLFSSRKMPNPLKFRIGGKQVIEGVEEGVKGLRTGEIRKMIIPPALSKRTFHPDFMSPDSTLLYMVELVDILE